MSAGQTSYVRGGKQKNFYTPDEVEYCNCPLCGTSESDFIYTERGNLKIVKCRSCNLIYVNPRVKGSEKNYWGDEQVYLEEAKYVFNGQKKHHRDKNYEDELVQIQQFKHSGNLLDIGSSMGFFLQKARQRGFSVTGVEPSPSLSNIARAQFGLDIINAYLEKAGLPEKKYDVITMIDVFEHVSNPKDILYHAKRTLKDDGVICIKVPNGNYNLLKLKLAKFTHRQSHHDIFDSYEHVVHYTKETMRKMLDSCGLIIEKTSIPLPIHPPVWAQRLGHYYQHRSPFVHDWKRVTLRTLFYLMGKTGHFMGLDTGFAADLLFIIRKK